MARRRSRKKKRSDYLELDLHGMKHASVQNHVEDFVLKHQHQLPIRIITGNSEEMKKFVRAALATHGFSYYEGDLWNQGYIMVMS